MTRIHHVKKIRHLKIHRALSSSMNYFGSKKVASKIKVEIRRFSSFSINVFEIQKMDCGIAKA